MSLNAWGSNNNAPELVSRRRSPAAIEKLHTLMREKLYVVSRVLKIEETPPRRRNRAKGDDRYVGAQDKGLRQLQRPLQRVCRRWQQQLRLEQRLYRCCHRVRKGSRRSHAPTALVYHFTYLVLTRYEC